MRVVSVVKWALAAALAAQAGSAWSMDGGRACALADAQALRLGASGYLCAWSAPGKAVRAEAMADSPSPQESIFWAGAIGFALAASEPESKPGGWAYQALPAKGAASCAAISEADARDLAVEFGRDPARMGTQAFAAKAWAKAKLAACGRRAQAAAPTQGPACRALAQEARLVGWTAGFKCSEAKGGVFVDVAAPGEAMAYDEPALMAAMAAGSALGKGKLGMELEFQAAPNFAPDACAGIPFSELDGLGLMVAKAGGMPAAAKAGLPRKAMGISAMVAVAKRPGGEPCPGYKASGSGAEAVAPREAPKPSSAAKPRG